MVSVERIQDNSYNYSPRESKRKEAAQGVAVGVGTTGAVSYQAKKVAAKNGLRTVFTNVNKGTRVISENAGEVSSLYGKFINDVQRFSRSLMARFASVKDMKIIGPLLNNPAARFATRGFGVVMAFFALVTGVRKAVDNGRLAVGDIKDKLNIAA